MSTKELTTKNLCTLFGVGTMTINNWRKGSTRITPLPAHTKPRGTRASVHFKLSEVKKWAKANNIEMVVKLVASNSNSGSTQSQHTPTAA